MEAFYQQKWVQLRRPEVRMSNPPFPKREYPKPERSEPFFRDEAPGFLGPAIEPGPVIATSASLSPPTPEIPGVRNPLFEPNILTSESNVPLGTPGVLNPLFEPRGLTSESVVDIEIAPKPYSEMSLEELKVAVQFRGVAGAQNLNKKQLLEVLESDNPQAIANKLKSRKKPRPPQELYTPPKARTPSR